MSATSELKRIGSLKFEGAGKILLGLFLVLVAVAMVSAIATPLGQKAADRLTSATRGVTDKLSPAAAPGSGSPDAEGL